jgi:hypothetical protein
MKRAFYLGSIICMITFLQSCYYDKADLLYPNSGANGSVCDTAGVISYSQKIVPILQPNCYSCHNTSLPSGGIAMSTYATDKAIAVNGKLYGSINHAAGYIAMPQSAPKLSTCQLATIKKWVDAGSPNN